MTVDPAMAALGAWIFSCIACPLVAESKGRDVLGWFLLGLVFGPLAFLVIWAMAPQQASDIAYLLGLPRFGTYARKVCPSCMSSVHADAKVCRYCHRNVPEAPEVVRNLRAGTCPRCGMRLNDAEHDVLCRL
jgi:hypothetical protein